MELSQGNIRTLAALARLRLTDEEVARYQHDLGAILGHIDRLKSYMADKHVTIDRRVVDTIEGLRADEPNPPRTAEQRAELLAGARAVRDGYVVVPGVFGDVNDK